MAKPLPPEQKASLEDYKRQLENERREIDARLSQIEAFLTGETVTPESFPPTNGNGPKVKPGMYRHLKFGQALFAYLQERGTVPVSKVAIDLTDGGVATLQKQKSPGERIRRVRITIGNNKRRLVFDPTSDTVKLREEEKL
jgi:hypothetical protein